MIDQSFDSLKSNRAWLLALGVIYFTGYGWFLVYSDFLPYVIDNNETFSSIVHAANIYHFGIGKTFGLTDEAYGLSAAAHPYVYTHQGNFPRLFALLLYSLGARSAESQILLTTFTIGFLGVCFAFSYFSRVTNNTFAIIFCVLLMSDYMMFAQWQVNTWQVWHVFFFFSSLLWIHRLGTSCSPYWVALGVVNFACLFYYEILFSVFVVTFCGIYAAHRYFTNRGTLVRAWAILAGGPAVGAAVLVAQNVAYLGWDKFVMDLDLTYTGRNRALAGVDFLRQLEAFYDQNHIVFWHNIVDASYLRSLPEIARHFFNFSLITYSPLLVLLAVAVGLAWLIGNEGIAQKHADDSSPMNEARSGVGSIRPPINDSSLYLAAAFTTFAAAVLIDSAVIGAQRDDPGVMSWAAKIAALLLIFLATRFEFRRLLDSDASITFRQVVRTLLFLLLAAAFVRAQQGFYDLSYAPLWKYLAARFGSVLLLQFLVIATVWVVIRPVLNPGAGMVPSGLKGQLAVLGPYLLCGAAAYVVTAFLLPGYLKTVYLDRFAPLTVFFHLVPFALLIYVFTGCGSNGIRHFVQRWRTGQIGTDRKASLAWRAGNIGKTVLTTGPQTLLAVTFLPFTVAYWVALQSVYFELLPADNFAFLKQLQALPFKGASFAVNTYAAPVAVATGTWAYFDPILGQGVTKLTEHGFEVARNLDLLWLADKNINKEYLEPEYFLCVKPQNLKTEIESLKLGKPWPGCSVLPLVKNSKTIATVGLDHKLVSGDASVQDRWAIVKMDWDYPPYLQRRDSGDTEVGVGLRRYASRFGFDVHYEFAQQRGRPESGTIFALYSKGDSPQGCAKAAEIEFTAQSSRPEDITLSTSFTGIAQIGVTPRTTTKAGQEYRSSIVSIGNRKKACDVRTASALANGWAKK